MKLFPALIIGSYILANFFLSALSKKAKEFDYCTITCKGKKHTMCEYKAGGPEECKAFSRELSLGEKAVLIDVHNALRQQVAMGKGVGDGPQTSASNIMELKWSDEAAMIAQRWADQCNVGQTEDVCRSLNNSEPGGQNMLDTHTNDQVDVYFFQKHAVLDWFKTGANFDRKSLLRYKPDPATAPYSQIVWANTEFVGCGFSNGTLNGTNVWRLVCNYYPAGNIEGKPVYLEGKTCSQCPNVKCSTAHPGLCEQNMNLVYNRNDNRAVSGPALPAYTVVATYLAVHLVCLGFV